MFPIVIVSLCLLADSTGLASLVGGREGECGAGASRPPCPTQPPSSPRHRSLRRQGLDELTSVLQRGDRLVVSELSRLGRSLGQIVAILDALAKAGVAFVALKENIRVEGKNNIQTKVMTTLLALFAEVERDLISERTREGLGRAREEPPSNGLDGGGRRCVLPRPASPVGLS